MDDQQFDMNQIAATDALLADKFNNQTPAQVRMAKARAARSLKAAEKKNTSYQKGFDERKYYFDALLALIVAKNPRSLADFESAQILAQALINHLKEKFSE